MEHLPEDRRILEVEKFGYYAGGRFVGVGGIFCPEKFRKEKEIAKLEERRKRKEEKTTREDKT